MTATEPAVAMSYRELLSQPVLRRLAIADICARLPQGMVGITLLLVAAQHASMTVAGLVVASYTLGQAVTGPVRGRLADRRGLVPVAAICGLSYTVALIALLASSLAAAPAALLTGIAATAGLVNPPLSPGMRSLWSSSAGPRLKHTAFALDAAVFDLAYITGPVVASGLATGLSPVAAVAVLLALTALAVIAIARPACHPADPQPARPQPMVPGPVGPHHQGSRPAESPPARLRRSRLGPLRSPALRRLLLAAALVNAGISATEVALTGYARAHHVLWASGPLLAGISIGSIVGSLVFGARAYRLTRLLAGYACGLAVLTAAGLYAPLLAVAAPLAGLCLGPTLAALFGAAAAAAPHGNGTETQAWINSTMNSGAAAGAAMAGLVSARPVLALGLAAATAATAAVSAVTRSRRHQKPGPPHATLTVPGEVPAAEEAGMPAVAVPRMYHAKPRRAGAPAQIREKIVRTQELAEPRPPAKAAPGAGRRCAPAMPSLGTGLRRIRPMAPDIAWAVFVLINLAAMRLLPQWQTVPFLAIWVSLTIVYGFRLWRLQPTIVTWTAVTLATGGIILVQVIKGQQDADYLAEVPLIALMFLVMVWHGRRRLAATAERLTAMEEVQRISQENLRLLEQQRQFLQDASHELGTPITIALGHAELIEQTADQAVAADARVVTAELARLRRLTNRLLLLASAGTPDFLHLAPVSADALVLDALERWGSVPRRWRLGEVAEATVLGDSDRLVAALDALLENAVAHTEKGDTIEVSVRIEGGQAELAVTDSGCGIPPGELDRIFRRFARAQPFRTGRETGGFGLGLPIVQAIAEAHRGSVRVRSTSGEGSTFAILIPVAAGRPAVG